MFDVIMVFYNITIDEVGKSKHNKILLRYKESKDKTTCFGPSFI